MARYRLPTCIGAILSGGRRPDVLREQFPEDLQRRAASCVDRILRGAKVRELPIERPTKFELIVNVKAAKAIGLTIPEAFLLRADELIE